MKYSHFFTKLLLEQDLPDDSRIHDQDPDAIAGFLDDEDVDDTTAFDTEGISENLAKIEQNFESKMSLLDDIENLDKKEISSRLDQLEEYLTTLRAFVDSKDEVDMRNPYSIMANIIRSDTVKKTNFDQMIKAIDSFKDASRKEEQAVEQAAREVRDNIQGLAKARKSVTGPEMRGNPQSSLGQYGMNRESNRRNRNKRVIRS